MGYSLFPLYAVLRRAVNWLLDVALATYIVSDSMTTFHRTSLAVASLIMAVALSGCCVTSVSSKRACETPAVQPSYEQAIPQGIAPEEPWPNMTRPVETAPAPEPYVPPTPVPSSASRKFGAKTSMKLKQYGDDLRDTFTRS